LNRLILVLIIFVIVAFSIKGIEIAYGQIDKEWQLKEHQSTGGSTLHTFTLTPPTLSINSGSGSGGQGTGMVFKVFNKTDIINKNFNVTWAGSFTGEFDIMVVRNPAINGTKDQTLTMFSTFI